MSSSTSNSNQDPHAASGTVPRRRDTWRIVATVVLSLVALDSGVREFLLPRSRDFVHIQDFPGAASLSQAPGRKLAVIGNSAVREGVDPQLLRKCSTTGKFTTCGRTSSPQTIRAWSIGTA